MEEMADEASTHAPQRLSVCVCVHACVCVCGGGGDLRIT